jgi:phosphoadenosine phosphosulfate reductase
MIKYRDLNGVDRYKDLEAIEVIKEYEPLEGYYLAFSGGKDSVVIYDLAKRSDVRFEPHYHFTTVDPPELTKFIKDNYNVVWDRPKKSMFKLIEGRGFPPTRQIRYCCSELKEYGGRGMTIVTGVRKAESRARSKRIMYHEDTRFKNTYYLNPILEWKDEDVWDYIRTNKIKYCSLYDEGFDRIGCIMCPLSGTEQRVKESKRWPKFYNAYLRAIGRGLESHKMRASKRSGTTAEQMMSWWLYGDSSVCSEQCELFG